MTFDARIALFVLAELFAVLQANAPDTLKQWIAEVVEDFCEPDTSDCY